MTLLLGFLRSLVISRETLALENFALRQQLASYGRTTKRLRLRTFDRVFLGLALEGVEQLVHGAHRREARDCTLLAPSRIQAVLAMEVPQAASRKANYLTRAHRIHQTHEQRQSSLGRGQNQ